MRTYKQIKQMANTLDEHDENGEIPLPYSWALLFLYKYWRLLMIGLHDESAKDELRDIVDWIENGDPQGGDDE